MAYLSSETNLNRLIEPSSIPILQRLSLRSIKGIAVGVLLCTILAFWVLWKPTYLQLRSLEKEKDSLQDVLKTGVTNSITTIPTMDQLPDLIEQCRIAFGEEGVNVVALNVERFGESREKADGASIDYGLVRFHLSGDWAGIVTTLKVFEEMQEVSIHVQDVVLDAGGGETLLQIYFCTVE